MIVQPRHPDDDAVFTCEASNDYGSDSKVFTVIVPGVWLSNYRLEYTIEYEYDFSDLVCILIKIII